jgi:predicted DNA-binding transcriptional regulator AlpA
MKLINCADVAALLGMKESWVRDRCRPSTPDEDRIPGMVRLGKKYVKFQDTKVIEWIENGCKPLASAPDTRVKSFSLKKANA